MERNPGDCRGNGEKRQKIQPIVFRFQVVNELDVCMNEVYVNQIKVRVE